MSGAGVVKAPVLELLKRNGLATDSDMHGAACLIDRIVAKLEASLEVLDIVKVAPYTEVWSPCTQHSSLE